jgi:hypothetical protein
MIFEVKDRTRINENFNGLKAGQLVEIVKESQLEKELA